MGKKRIRQGFTVILFSLGLSSFVLKVQAYQFGDLNRWAEQAGKDFRAGMLANETRFTGVSSRIKIVSSKPKPKAKLQPQSQPQVSKSIGYKTVSNKEQSRVSRRQSTTRFSRNNRFRRFSARRLTRRSYGYIHYY